MGNVPVVEVLEIVFYPMFSAAFIERFSKNPSGSQIGNQLVEVPSTFPLVVVGVVQIMVFHQDRVQHRFAQVGDLMEVLITLSWGQSSTEFFYGAETTSSTFPPSTGFNSVP